MGERCGPRPRISGYDLGTHLFLGRVRTYRRTLGPAHAEPIQEHISTTRPLGNFSRYGDWAGQWVPNVIYMGAQASLLWSTSRQTAQRRLVHMFKSSLYSGLMTVAMKYTFAEERPDGSDHFSFPSGHSSTAFAFASVVSSEHGWQWGIPAYLLASFVGFSRMNDNKHDLHDVIAGATLGISYGMGIYERQRGAQKSQFHSLMIFPLEDGAGMIAHFTF